MIVQIGSNDGVTGDPLHNIILQKSNWRILFVEPVPYLFKKLMSNYPKSDRFLFENVAINEGKKQRFYYVTKEANKNLSLPVWYDQLGSFKKSHILKHLDGILEPYIKELEVEGAKLEILLKKHKVRNLDFLHIDTEGYDWKILSQLDLDIFRPRLILFEFKHLSKKDRQNAVSFLDKDFNIYVFEFDYLCIRKEIMKRKDLKTLIGYKIN
ncbi:FkbM family methyltransferase [Gramella jeungdoensis]|uniref:FkbM family methyltransferase n=1 Tax=Gramella jeungdoensis TaxID=708091 RepID=A0ABT0Z0G2_9FLAO|nr:FkbM family methyltransferase [Gramella jeungdoensis]MCM8569211.1 FkbM family methyltransferase [Gramella jeungdoensis]